MRHWTTYLLIACIVFVGGVLFDRFVLRPTIKHEIIVGDKKTLTDVIKDPLKPRFPHFIFIEGEDGKIDTFIATPDTPIKDFPVVCCTTYFPVLVFVDNKDESYEGSVMVYGQGIIDSVQVSIPQKKITLYKEKDNLDLYAGLTVWIDQAKRMSADIEGGIRYKRFGLKAKVWVDGDYNTKLMAGLSVGI